MEVDAEPMSKSNSLIKLQRAKSIETQEDVSVANNLSEVHKLLLESQPNQITEPKVRKDV